MPGDQDGVHHVEALQKIHVDQEGRSGRRSGLGVHPIFKRQVRISVPIIIIIISVIMWNYAMKRLAITRLTTRLLQCNDFAMFGKLPQIMSEHIPAVLNGFGRGSVNGVRRVAYIRGGELIVGLAILFRGYLFWILA
jgi:hypothetical protein